MTRPRRRQPSVRGFTIVELLVTIGVIAVLMGLLVTGLRAAIGSARKTKELNGMRGVFAAWTQYANTYEEQILPGFLDVQTQSAWRTTYSNASGGALAPSLSQTYPWRLARYLDDPYGTLLGYVEADEADSNSLAAGEWDGGPPHPAWMNDAFGAPGSEFALQPAFAYNAYYLGGWHESNGGVSTMKFADSSWVASNGGATSGRLVCTRLANISRTSELVVFASGTLRGQGNYRPAMNPEDRIPGNAWIVPPTLGQTPVWEPYLGMQQGVAAPGADIIAGISMLMPQGGATDSGILQVNVAQGVPVRRHNGLVATVRADGSTESASVGALMDMRRWIDAADRDDFTHQEN